MPRVRGFRSNGRPYVHARVRLPRLQAEAEIAFLVDTGADGSVIHLPDRGLFDAASVRTGAGLAAGAMMSGIGAERNPYAVEEAEYTLDDESGVSHPLSGRVLIQLNPAARGVPSLLGRDLLDLMTFCISEREITLDW